MSLLDFAGPASTAGALPTGPRESQGDDDGRSFGQGGGFENHSCGAAAACTTASYAWRRLHGRGR